MDTRALTSRNRLLEATILGVLPLLAAPVAAQTRGALEEIIVTAQKREQSLQDVGIAVTAFTGDQMRDMGYFTGPDIAAQTPGLQFREGPLSHLVYSNIRGVSQNDFTGHVEVPIATYVDQAYMSLQAASSFQMFDLERVEVLRGPQGTLFGRNATGGLIHYVTRPPTDQFEAYTELRGGQHDLARFEAAVSGPLTGTLKGRISALVNYWGDYQTNLAGEDLMGREDYALRAQLLFEPSDNVSARLIGTYGESDQTFAFKHSSNGFDPVTGLEFSLPPDLNYYGNCPGCDPSGFRDDLEPYTSEQNFPGIYKPESLNVTGILTWSIGDTKLTSVTNYLDYKFFYQEDSEMSTSDGWLGIRTQDLDQVTQELRVEREAERSRWVGGAYLIDRQSKNGADQGPASLQWFDDILAGLGAIPPGFVADLGSVNRLISDFMLDTFSWAAFGQVEYDFAPRWTALLGLRWTEDRNDYEFVSREFLDGVPTGPGFLLGELTFTRETVGSLARMDSGDLSAHLGLHFRPMDDWLGFVSYSRANKGGTFSAPFTGGDVTRVDPEILETYEVGFKSLTFDDRLRLNASAFYSDYTDYQGFIFLEFATAFRNIDAKVRGFEAELVAAPVESLELGLGVAYLDTEADTRIPTAEGGTRSTELPLAPPWSVNALAKKSWRALGGTMALHADVVYTDEHFSEVLNSQASRISSSTLINASIGYTGGDGRWGISIHGRNIGADKTPIYRIPTHIGFNQDMYGPPRWVFGQFNYRWE